MSCLKEKVAPFAYEVPVPLALVFQPEKTSVPLEKDGESCEKAVSALELAETSYAFNCGPLCAFWKKVTVWVTGTADAPTGRSGMTAPSRNANTARFTAPPIAHYFCSQFDSLTFRDATHNGRELQGVLPVVQCALACHLKRRNGDSDTGVQRDNLADLRNRHHRGTTLARECGHAVFFAAHNECHGS